MTNTTEILDYEIVESKYEGDFEVWTPSHEVGACIGCGKTREEAAKNAIACLGKTIADLAETIA